MTDTPERPCPICGRQMVKPRTESRAHFEQRRTCSRRCGQRLRRIAMANSESGDSTMVSVDTEARRPRVSPLVMDDAKRAKAIARRDEIARRLLAKYGPPRLASDSSFRPDP